MKMREGCIQWDEQRMEGMCMEGRMDEEMNVHGKKEG